ncbi:MAG: hypothetical protein KDA61_20815 [Planctomycetales bacterium]|nr:hypothetical protein [Planctomycetales bacterium]
MANRLFVGGVLALWIGSMAWLLVDKVLPSFSGGSPPPAAGFEPGVPVGWRVEWEGRQVGTAASVRLPGTLHTTELHNRVELYEMPLLELAPSWVQHVVGDIGSLKFVASTRLEFDSLDNFSAFESRVAVNDVDGVLKLAGRMKDGFLNLTVHAGEVSYKLRTYIPNESALSEALFPNSKLPYMYVGRKWQEEVYSPFRSPRLPVEMVEAEVTAVESLQRDGENVRAMRVEFRTESGAGIPEAARLQAVAWVEPESGVVLRQDVVVGRSHLRFERLSEEESDEVGRTLFATKLGGKPRGQTTQNRIPRAFERPPAQPPR